MWNKIKLLYTYVNLLILILILYDNILSGYGLKGLQGSTLSKRANFYFVLCTPIYLR